MALASAQIVDAVVSRLSGNTPASTRVYASRVHPLSTPELPAWRVFADEETITTQTVHYPAVLEHSLSVQCDGYVQANSSVDDAMHAMAEQALIALYDTLAHTTLGITNLSVNAPQRIDREVVNEGQANLGRIGLSLLMRYRTALNDPATII